MPASEGAQNKKRGAGSQPDMGNIQQQVVDMIAQVQQQVMNTPPQVSIYN